MLIVTGPICDAVLVLNPEVFGCMPSASPVECCGVWSVVTMFASLPEPGDHAAQLHSGLRIAVYADLHRVEQRLNSLDFAITSMRLNVPLAC
jgi:hypothetical protein